MAHGTSRSSAANIDTFHYRAPVDLTLSGLLFVDNTGGGAGRTLTAFVNGVATALVTTITDGGTGGASTENASTSAPVAAGDKVSVVARKTGAGNMFGGNRLVLVAPGSSAISPMVATSAGAVQDNSTRLLNVSGNLSAVTYAAADYLKVRSPGDWRGLYAYVSANSGSGAVTIKGSKNNVDTALAISIGAGETGYFFDASNVVAVADDDNLLYVKTGAAGAAVTLTVLGSSIVHQAKKQQLYGYANRAWAFGFINAGAYIGMPGNDYGNAVGVSELPKYERTIGYPARISRLQVGVVNLLNVAVVTTLLVNGEPTALSVTTAAGATALGEDGVNSVVVAAGDRIAFVHQSVGATSGTFNANAVSILIEDLTPPWRPTTTFHG